MRWRPAITSARAAERRPPRALPPGDADRDQSYFLFATTQEQIDFLRFPLGDLTKAETRRLAADMGLVVADKPDSQDICFVPQGNYADVITKLKPERGAGRRDRPYRRPRARPPRRHPALHRRPAEGPGRRHRRTALCRLSRCRAPRRVIVGPREALDTRSLHLRDINWLGDVPLDAIAAGRTGLLAKRALDPPARPARLFAAGGAARGRSGRRRSRHRARPGLRAL